MNSRFFLDKYYIDDNNERHMYDLVFPENAKGELGLLLCIHGGGWVEGSKVGYTNELQRISENEGLAAACINYRYLSETVSFEDELDDITSALSAIKATGAEYGVDFNKVLLTGISAGGHLSLLYAYTRMDTAPIKPVCIVELCGPTNFENPMYYSEEDRICASAGVEYFRRIISNGIGFDIDIDNLATAQKAMQKNSPVNYIDKDTIPTFFGHGVNDDIVPYQNALDLDAKLTEYNVKHELISFPNSNHECEDKASMKRMMELFFECLNKYLK